MPVRNESFRDKLAEQKASARLSTLSSVAFTSNYVSKSGK